MQEKKPKSKTITHTQHPDSKAQCPSERSCTASVPAPAPKQWLKDFAQGEKQALRTGNSETFLKGIKVICKREFQALETMEILVLSN